MRAPLPLVVTLLGLSLCATQVHAAVERLDDSASPRATVQAQLDLNPLAGQTGAAPQSPVANIRFGRIEYRLSTASYIGRAARIYYVIPALIPGLTSPAAMQVQWRAQGVFASGQGRPGDRVLVWSGQVREPWMGDAFDLDVQLDLRQLRLARGANLGFESYFEIETNP